MCARLSQPSTSLAVSSGLSTRSSSSKTSRNIEVRRVRIGSSIHFSVDSMMIRLWPSALRDARNDFDHADSRDPVERDFDAVEKQRGLGEPEGHYFQARLFQRRQRPFDVFRCVADVIDQAVVLLEHGVYRRRLRTGPDDFDIGHAVVVAHRQVDLLQRIVASASGAVSEIVEIAKSRRWRPYSQAKMMEFQAVSIHGCPAASVPPFGTRDSGATSPAAPMIPATRAAHCRVTRGLG